MKNDPLDKQQKDWLAFNAKKRKGAPVQKNAQQGSEKKRQNLNLK